MKSLGCLFAVPILTLLGASSLAQEAAPSAPNENFEARFLRRDIQRALIWRVLAPWNWLRLASPWFGRSDLAAEYYDEQLFHGPRSETCSAVTDRRS